MFLGVSLSSAQRGGGSGIPVIGSLCTAVMYDLVIGRTDSIRNTLALLGR